VVAINVLEHIPDDAAAVRSFAGLLRPGGRVVLWVPAFEGLMSAYDRRVGHQRRYRLDSLRTVLEGAGLEVERLHYVNSLGLVAWFVMMRLLGGQPQAGPALRFWDRFVIPVLRRVESRVRPPFGQSVFAVARRPTLDQPRAA
jgi:SAM-dependent methyltransferase